jgi:hypothetical protein
LCQPWASNERIDRARELLDESLTRSRDVPSSNLPRAMTSVVRAALAAGCPDRAEDLARGIGVPGDRSWCLADVAGAAARAGDIARARKLIVETEQHLKAITGRGTRAGPLANLTDALIAVGEVDRAEEIALTIIRPDWLASALADVARARAENGDHARAEELARRISEPDSLANALVKIAGPADDRRAVRLLAEALTLGSWTDALPELATRRPEVIGVLARAVIDRG